VEELHLTAEGLGDPTRFALAAGVCAAIAQRLAAYGARSSPGGAYRSPHASWDAERAAREVADLREIRALRRQLEAYPLGPIAIALLVLGTLVALCVHH
jgi:hypothetical protein